MHPLFPKMHPISGYRFILRFVSKSLYFATFGQATTVAWLFFIPGSNPPGGGKAQTAQHGVRRAAFALRIQMHVDVRRRAEIAVPQPLLNLLERDAVRQQERCAAVPLRYNYDKPGKP